MAWKVAVAVSVEAVATPSVATMVGAEAVIESELVRLVTSALGVALVKVTTAVPAPPAAPLAQPVQVPAVNVPPETSFKVLVVLILAAVVLLAILAKAAATCAAEAPEVPAVKVRPAIVKVWPVAKALKVTAAVSVVPGAAPSEVTIPGVEVPCATAKVVLKLGTSVLAVVLVKVTPPPAATPLVQPLEMPLVKEPPVALLKVFVVLIFAAAVPLAMLAKALASCAAVAPKLPAVKVKPAMVKV